MWLLQSNNKNKNHNNFKILMYQIKVINIIYIEHSIMLLTYNRYKEIIIATRNYAILTFFDFQHRQ